MSVLLLSGGVDSLVLLARECHAGRPPRCLIINYGQRHRREVEQANSIAEVYRVACATIRLPSAIFLGSALTGGDPVPLDRHYADPGQASTVVPNRNMVFLAIAAAYAVQLGEDLVLFAAHAGDYPVYPDCRPEFVDAADAALRLACGVRVSAPFVGMTKAEVVRLGRSLDVPFSLSWSCYQGGDEPCGRCGACVERAEALAR
jgi:7-cyano-7-deazaguanine synthase